MSERAYRPEASHAVARRSGNPYLLAVVVVAICAASRVVLERTMWGQMLLQLPLLLVTGAFIAAYIASYITSYINPHVAPDIADSVADHVGAPLQRDRVPVGRGQWHQQWHQQWNEQWNRQGAAGLVLASGIVALWMIPRLLDAALEQPLVDVTKMSMLIAAGALGWSSWRAAPPIVRVFMLGNLAWMTATVGLLLLDAPERLCASYGANDQRVTGYGLVLIALFIVVAAFVRFSAPASSHASNDGSHDTSSATSPDTPSIALSSHHVI